MTVEPNFRNGVALVIGVGQYPHPDIARLPFATHDAEAVARALIDANLCAFPAEQVVLLTNEAAQRDAIIHHLAHWLPEQGRDAEMVVLYFAGHGIVQKLGKEEEGFLIPHDADPANPASRGVAMREIARYVDGIQASAVVVILDCCHAGKVLQRGANESLRRDMTIRPAILQHLSGKGRYLLASCDEGQFSVELADLKHGLFTYHLLEGLSGAGDRDGDGKVGIAELFEYVSEAVARDAHKLGFVQEPWNASVGAGGVFLAIPGRRVTTTLPVSALEPPLPQEATAAALQEIERQLPDADEALLLKLLRTVAKFADPAGVRIFFRFLNHSCPSVRDLAKRALQALGRDQVLAAVKEQVRHAEETTQQLLIEGLAFYEAAPDLLNVLHYLIDQLEGDALVRAHQLLEKKRLSLELEKTRGLFAQNHSPYVLEKVLGQGLFTAAYLARHELADVAVVVRVLRPEFVSQPEIRKQFLDLSRRSMRFVHQNLVLTRDVGVFPDQQVYFTVRDYVPGVTLQEVLHGGKRFELGQVLRILHQVVQALTPVHRDKSFHGGIKPSNIFLPGEDVVILGDPSPPVQGVGVALQRRLAYDYRYAAPETLLGGALTPAVDFYALGCVAYELLCGQPPFVAEHHNELLIQHVRELVPRPTSRHGGLSEREEVALLAFLEKDAARRVRSIAGAMEALGVFDEHDNKKVAPAVGVSQVPEALPLLGAPSLARYQPANSLASLDQAKSLPIWPTNPGTLCSEAAPGFAPGNWLPLAPPGYELIQELGRGGMGVVYKAQHLALQRTVALKVILGGGHAGSEHLERFRREAQSVARLQHPNIIQIFETGQVDGQAFFAMEYVEGESLAQQLATAPLAPRAAARLVEQLAQAMQVAHAQGIIHRDLKPANVLLTKDGIPKITDFGLARQVDRDSGQTHSGMILGTPSYMAPEQASGRAHAVGATADVYALGAILYESLTGRTPFKGNTPLETLNQVLNEEPVPPSRLQPKTPLDLETICLKCLRKQPEQRYASAAALAEDLRRWQDGAPILARPTGFLERLYKWARRRPTVLALWMMTLAWLIALLLYFWWKG